MFSAESLLRYHFFRVHSGHMGDGLYRRALAPCSIIPRGRLPVSRRHHSGPGAPFEAHQDFAHRSVDRECDRPLLMSAPVDGDLGGSSADVMRILDTPGEPARGTGELDLDLSPARRQARIDEERAVLELQPKDAFDAEPPRPCR